MPDFFINYQELRGLSLSEADRRLQQHPRKCVGDVTIKELSMPLEYPHGVYLLYGENGDLWYVGKATRRSFIERIPAHFDHRENAWFNTVIKRFTEKGIASDHRKALEMALFLQLVLVGVHEPSFGQNLERALRSFLVPKLNPGPKSFSGSENLASLVEL